VPFNITNIVYTPYYIIILTFRIPSKSRIYITIIKNSIKYSSNYNIVERYF